MGIYHFVVFVVGIIMIIFSACVPYTKFVKSAGATGVMVIVILGIGITLVSSSCYTAGYTKGEKHDKSGLIKILP